MRLQTAIPIDELAGFGEDPYTRRRRRKKARARRRLRKLRQRRGRIRERAGLPRKPRRRAPAHPPQTWQEPALEPVPTDWSDPMGQPEVLDASWTAGAHLGAQGVPRWRARARARQEAGWGPSVRMGHNLRIQAANGHRAAVIDLKPGLYLVAEVPEQATRPEFGVLPLLAPMMLTAAKGAIDAGTQAAQGRGPLAALFNPGRAAANPGVRAVPVQAAPVQAAPAVVAQPVAAVPVQRALPGPTAAQPMVVQAPNVGWADDETVAIALGCESCRECGR